MATFQEHELTTIDGDDVMVDIDNNGNIQAIYAYADAYPRTIKALGETRIGANPVFIHAANPQDAWMQLQRIIIA